MRQLKDWERSMGAQMGALPGMTVLYDHCGDLVAAEIDAITDNDGWAEWEFVFDAEARRCCRASDVIAVVLPGADAQVALAEAEAVFYG